MTRGTLRIRLIALTAAYVLALQGLFVAWAPMAPALSGFPLCSGEIAGVPEGPAGPGGHDRGCLSACAMLGAADIPVPPVIPPERHVVAASRSAALVAQALPGTPGGPLRARGPPAV
jgi:hypothetical protein